MISSPSSPLCYSCAHRRNVPGDAHSACAHLAIHGVEFKVAVIVATQGGFDIPSTLGAGGRVAVRLDPHGIAKGWASWPLNFDPIWLRECTLHQPREPLPVAAKEVPDANRS